MSLWIFSGYAGRYSTELSTISKLFQATSCAHQFNAFLLHPPEFAASVLEPADDVVADALEALPAVLGGEAGRSGLRLLCGTGSGLPRLGGCLLAVGALAWQGLGGLRLDRFGSGDGLALGWCCRFTLLRDGLGGLGSGGLGPGGHKGHLGIVGEFLAHGWAVESGSLAGVAQLPHFPHQLGEVVARVEVVGAAQVGFALEVAVVGASRGLALAGTPAGDTQTGVVPDPRHHHGAGVLGLGAESNGLVPDAALLLLLLVVIADVVGLSVRHTNKRCQEQEQHPHPGSHGGGFR